MKKKIFIPFVLVLAMLSIFSSCDGKDAITKKENNLKVEVLSGVNESLKETTHIMTNEISQPHTNNDEQDNGDGIIELRKYRVRYYSIPAPFADLVGREICYDWEVEYNSLHDLHSSERMIIVDFINDFNISKEDFERANLELAKSFSEHHSVMRNPLDHANQEIYEIFNADIIYTFDDEIINEYYLSHDYPFLFEHEYEEAIANGTYQTRTTDWIDIEQMEADIIAKYGEAEFVTETTTTTLEQIVTTDLSQIETTE